MSKSKKLRIRSSNLSWLAPTLHGTVFDQDPRMLKCRDAILARDNYTCYYCDFRSEEYQEIHHFNDDHNDFSESNLTTVCPLCHQVFHLSTCSQATGGSIIVINDSIMTQVELNNLCRMMFIARASGIKEWENNAKQINDTLKSTQSIVEQQISANGSEPMIFAKVLQDLDPKILEEDYMLNFKLLPKFNRFEPIVEYWRDNTFKDLPVEKWKTLVPSNINLQELEKRVSAI